MCDSVRVGGGIVLILTLVLAPANPASAQIVPAPSFSGWGYAYPYDAYMTQASSNYLTNRQMAAQGAAQAQATWSGINQSTLADARAENQAMLSSRQSAKSWWFNYQAQRMPQERADLEAASRRRAADARLVAQAPVAAPAQTSQAIMQWPALLQEPQFAGQRSAIEAPFLRAASGGKPVSSEDYRGIIDVAQDMKTQLRTLGANWPYAEVVQTEDYLDLITKQAESRMQPAPSP